MATPSKVNTIPISGRAGATIGVLVTLIVFVVGLFWAKWMPYTAKALRAQRTHH
jgi:uncharacterized protein